MSMVVVVCAFLSSVLSAPFGQIAYLSGAEQEDRCVCVLDLKTESITRMGRGRRDNYPVWSPDGEWIAFESMEDGMRIFLVRAAGSDLHAISHADKWNRWPAWSPDGKRLAYVGSDGSPDHQVVRVYTVESETEESWGIAAGAETPAPPLLRPVWLGESLLVALLQAQLEELEPGEAPGWSGVEADSKNTLLAIGVLGRPGNLSTGIFVVTPARALLLPAAVMPSRGSYVEWAVEPGPSGKLIAFESNDGGDREIFLLSSKGAYNVSNHRAADWNPVWSPKGDRLAFESFRGGRRGVYQVDPETAYVRAVAVSDVADCWAPTWSPDGKWIAFVSTMSGNPEIWVARVATGEMRQLTTSGGENLAPAWGPEKRR